MKVRKRLASLSVMGLIALYVPAVARGENTAVEASKGVCEAPAQPAPAQVNDKGLMGKFTLTPKLGYVYLGGQAMLITPKEFARGVDVNAMQIRFDLKFGDTGPAFELAPFYMLMQPKVAGMHKVHGLGIYLGLMYSWYLPTAKAGVFYPGVGFGWKGGGAFRGDIDWGAFTALRIPISCTWYFSKTIPIGIVLEWGFGIQTNVFFVSYNSVTTNQDGTQITQRNQDVSFQFGFYTDLTAGVRFF
jgi:hypothetical protein